MSQKKQKVYDVLARMGIAYDAVSHPAVYTIEEMDRLDLGEGGEVVKNLFLRDDKKKNYYLIVLQKDKKADLKKIRAQLSSRPLSFASEESLRECLNLEKGAVTPFGVLNDIEGKVCVAIDSDVLKAGRIGVHPNDNTATVWIAPADLENVIKAHGNPVEYIEI